jgi:hypothetical protein
MLITKKTITTNLLKGKSYMTLRSWITSQGGAERLSKKLNLTAYAVRCWLRRETTPKPETMLLIYKLSKRKLPIETIIKDTLPKH